MISDALDTTPASRGGAERTPVIGLFAAGLGAYWPQFPELRPQLEESAGYVATRLSDTRAQVIDHGFVSDAVEAEQVARALRVGDCDLVVAFLPTYATASMVVPIAREANAPMLVVNLQPTEAMDHDSFDTGRWLAYGGACPLPEIANALVRCGLEFRSVSGHLHDERAWNRIAAWVAASAVRRALRTGRHGLLGHLYPGMMDVSTDPTLVTANFGGHVEILEIDDLRVRTEQVTPGECAERVEQIRGQFDLDHSVDADELGWAARVSVGMDHLVADFALDTLAYYHRGLGGDIHEQIAAGMIVGASLLTARGIPAVGEYELRTSLAMMVMDRLGAGGSFTEFQALNFRDQVVEMGHDGPGHVAISAHRPLLRGLDIYHGKRGHGVSVEFDVAHGDVTMFGIGQCRDGSYTFIASHGVAVDGPRLKVGNTTSLVDVGMDPGEWTDAWSASGIGHHWALGLGHRIPELRACADLLGVDLVTVGS